MSSKLSQLCDKYQAIVFFDTETTGLDPSVDQIIELAAVRITRNQAGFLVLDEKMDAFVKLLEGQKLPDKIVELTHITDEMIQKDGVDATAAASAFNNLIRGHTLLVAHNAQFDLLFSRALLHYTDIGTNYGRTKRGIRGGGNTDRYPTSIIRAKSDKQHLALHPTQKPVDLLRWLIRTYTDEGALVLDNACGSGSTCVAAVEEGRNYIGMDNGTCENKNSPFYCRPWAEVAATRIEAVHG